MTPIESLKTAQSILCAALDLKTLLSPKSFRNHILNASLKLENAVKEIESGVDVLGREPNSDEKIRMNCAFLDETCVDCGEDCPAAGTT